MLFWTVARLIHLSLCLPGVNVGFSYVWGYKKRDHIWSLHYRKMWAEISAISSHLLRPVPNSDSALYMNPSRREPASALWFLQRSGYICTSLDCLTVRMGLTLTAHTWSHCSLAIRCSSRGMCWEKAPCSVSQSSLLFPVPQGSLVRVIFCVASTVKAGLRRDLDCEDDSSRQ